MWVSDDAFVSLYDYVNLQRLKEELKSFTYFQLYVGLKIKRPMNTISRYSRFLNDGWKKQTVISVIKCDEKVKENYEMICIKMTLLSVTNIAQHIKPTISNISFSKNI